MYLKNLLDGQNKNQPAEPEEQPLQEVDTKQSAGRPNKKVSEVVKGMSDETPDDFVPKIIGINTKDK